MRLLSPEALDESQKATFQDYARFLPKGSVCVNVVLGRESWDVRPIVLLDGNVSIMRFSPHFEESRTRQLAGDLEGFARLFDADLKVHRIPNDRQFFILRPFVTTTLQDDLEKGTITQREELEKIVRLLIKGVSALSRRSMAHGHISPANLAFTRGELSMLDPLMGAVHVTSDPYLPPESAFGVSPEPTADLFALGKMIRTLLGDSLSPRQSSVVEQLLLPSPRHRPPLAEVAVAFGVREEPHRTNATESQQTGTRASPGKLLRSNAPPRDARVDVDEFSDTPSQPKARGGLGGPLALILLVAAAAYLGKERYPAAYYSIAKRIPGLVADHSVEFDAEWASHQKPRMLVVARAAILRSDPAATNAITADILGGANPEGVRARLLRVALDELWRDQLSEDDVRAATALALTQLLPEGAKTIPPLKALHPAVILAVAGETQPMNSGKELQALSISTLASLPAPFGPLFTDLQKLGITTVGHPACIGLATIATGDPRATAFEGLMNFATDETKTRALTALVLPIVRKSSTGAEELFVALRDRGDSFGTLASWFAIEDLASWTRVPAITKLELLLSGSTQSELDLAQYSDLLKFPLPDVRAFALGMLRKKFFSEASEKVLVTLSSDANALSREQTIALLATLRAPPQSTAQFLAKWFELSPNADTVLLLLVARSNVDTSDIFNLEAARYLRRSSWRAPFPLLELLANHPEPLARVLAYGKLNPDVENDRALLKKRLSVEKDDGCLKALMAKLAVQQQQ